MPSNKDELTRSNPIETAHEGREPNTLIVEDQSLRFGFIQLPKQILYARNLTRDAKFLYAILLGYAWQEDSCFPGYSRLCDDMQGSENMVRKYMRELESVGLVKQKRRGLGKTNIYILCDLRTSKIEVLEHQKSKVLKPQFSNDKEYTSNNKKREKETDLSKGQKPSFSQQEGKDDQVTTYSHIARGAIGRQRDTKGNKEPSSKGEASKAPVQQSLTMQPFTQDEIDRKRNQGRNASGFESVGQIIGIPQQHLLEVDKQFGSKSSNGSAQPRATKQGNWKKAPLFIQSMIADWFSLELHDQAVHSTITSVDRIFKQWRSKHENGELDREQIEDVFRSLMYEARARAKRATITTRTPEGRPNRTPFFKAALEDLCGLREKAAGEIPDGLAGVRPPN